MENKRYITGGEQLSPNIVEVSNVRFGQSIAGAVMLQTETFPTQYWTETGP